MLGLGFPELALILVIGLVVFGPGKLPSVGGALGKSMREFKTAVNGAESGKETAPSETPSETVKDNT